MPGSKPKTSTDQKEEKQSGLEHMMDIKPEYIRSDYKGSGKLEGKVALITGGDSGIGRSIAVHFAREGANVAIAFLKHESEDAEETKKLIEKEGRKALLLPGDLRDKKHCEDIVEMTVKEFGKLNILVNNAAMQKPSESLEDLSDDQIESTFDVNVLSYFRVTRAAMKHLHEGDSIINSSSSAAHLGHDVLVDYSTSKGAVTAFTRSLATQLAEKKIRVNSVAAGPILTPMIVSTYPEEKCSKFGKSTPLGRPGQPAECGPSYVFLASQDSSYYTGQSLHPNGGKVLNT